jgi:hypothetical protein
MVQVLQATVRDHRRAVTTGVTASELSNQVDFEVIRADRA